MYVALAAVFFVLALGTVRVRQPLEYHLRSTPDDAYYYLTIARNLAAGVGSTFDGIHKTNGYHPLWCWALSGLAGVVRQPVALLYAAKAGAVLLSAGTCALFWVVGSVWGNARAGALAAAIYAANTRMSLSFPLSLMETAILGVALLASLLALAALIGPQRPPGPMLCCAGLALALVSLSRVDCGLLAPTALATLMLCSPTRARLLAYRRWLLVAVVIFALVVGPYFAWNVKTFGHLTPISGRVKAWQDGRNAAAGTGSMHGRLRRASSAALFGIPGNIAGTALPLAPGGWLWVLVLSGVVIGVGIIRRRQCRRASPSANRAPFPAVLAYALGIFLGVHWLVYSVAIPGFASNPYHAYYFWPESLAVVGCLGWLVDRAVSAADRRWPPLAWALYAVLGMAFLGAVVKERLHSTSPFGEVRVKTWVAARWLARNAGQEGLAAAWNAGMLGYFSERQVVNLDGLVNDERLFEARQTNGEARYISEEEIRYLVDYFAGDPRVSGEGEYGAIVRALSPQPTVIAQFPAPQAGLTVYVFRLSDRTRGGERAIR